MHSHIRDWLTTSMARLFEAETRRLDATITHLNQRNSEIKNQKFPGFRHQGALYVPAGLKHVARSWAMAKQPLPALAFALMGEAEAFLQDAARVQNDQDLIRQLFVRLLDPCTTAQEVRDALPDCVVQLVPELVRIERRCETAWSIRTDPRAWAQYTKLIPKIEMYAVARLLY